MNKGQAEARWKLEGTAVSLRPDILPPQLRFALKVAWDLEAQHPLRGCGDHVKT